MASRKQTRGAGPRDSPFCCLVLWLSWPGIPIFPPIRLSEPPPLRADSLSTSLQARFPLACDPRVLPPQEPSGAQHGFLWDTRLGKREAGPGVALTAGTGTADYLIRVQPTRGSGMNITVMCKKTQKQDTWLPGMTGFLGEVGPLSSFTCEEFITGFCGRKKQNESEKFCSLLSMIPTDTSLSL